jgi:hypothetical protein
MSINAMNPSSAAAGRPVPDENLVKRAFKVLEATETPMEKYLREEHNAMIAVARIGMDSARKIWPVELDHLPPDLHPVMAKTHQIFEEAYMTLDTISSHFHGSLVQAALLGVDHMGQSLVEAIEEEEERLGIGPKAEAALPQAAPAIDQAPQPGDDHPES